MSDFYEFDDEREDYLYEERVANTEYGYYHSDDECIESNERYEIGYIDPGFDLIE